MEQGKGWKEKKDICSLTRKKAGFFFPVDAKTCVFVKRFILV